MTDSKPIAWPERPTCHGEQAQFSRQPIAWRAPRGDDGGPYAEDFRTCSYCGCIHPEDLVKALQAGARLTGADWKYGWPHKFYVEGIPNPKAGKLARTGSCSLPAGRDPTEAERAQYSNWRMNGERWEGDHMSPAPATAHAKWYNEHLLDLEPEAFAVLAKLIEEKARIRFDIVEGQLRYSAPHRGFQQA